MSLLTCGACNHKIQYDQTIAYDSDFTPIHSDCAKQEDVKVTAIAERYLHTDCDNTAVNTPSGSISHEM
jgi:hypothetical protein